MLLEDSNKHLVIVSNNIRHKRWIALYIYPGLFGRIGIFSISVILWFSRGTRLVCFVSTLDMQLLT